MTDPIDDIMDLFDVSKNNDRSSESSDYDVTAEDGDKPDYDELVDNLDLSGGDKTPELKSENSELKNKNNENIIKEVISENDDTKDSTKIESPKKDQKTQESSNVSSKKSTVMETAEEQAMEKNNKSQSGCNWLLNSPSEKFNNFYNEKRDLLDNHLLSNGPIPFNKFEKELKQAKVDLQGDLYDLDSLYNKMRRVQMWRERLQEIILDLNKQYFCWERTIQLLHGVLARIQYEKPVIKQEGLIYEHMRDFENYFSNLKSLHASATQVSKTLEAAFDCFSRQLTIVQNNREVPTRYNKENSQNNQNNHDAQKEKASPNLDEYDDLGEDRKISSKKGSSGTLSWDSI